VKKILFVLIAIPVILWALWFVIPETTIQSIIEDYFTGKKFHVEIHEMKKGIFYNFSADKLVVRSSTREIIFFSNIHGAINPLSLLILQWSISVDGTLGGGNISGNVRLAKNNIQIRLDFTKAHIDQISMLKRAGINGTGTLSGRFSMINSKGNIDFNAEDGNFQQAEFAGVKVPLNFFNNVKGAIEINGDMLNIISVYCEGKNISARLKGVIKDAVMDLTMEVMPGQSFIENPFFFAELERYKISPGYYIIPVRSNFFL
jgi:type II secretion system protein N